MDVAPRSSSPVVEEENAVDAFVESTRSWEREEVPLSREVTTGLWVLAVANLLVGGWSVAVLSAVAPCSGLLCTFATLGDRHVLQLVLSCSYVALMIGAAAVTGGLTRANGVHLAVLVPTALIGVGTVFGAVVVVVVIVAGVTLVGSSLLVLIERL